MRNVFEVSFTQEGTGTGKSVFEGGFKFSASEARKKFNSKHSAVQVYEEQSAYKSIQEHQNWRVN